MFKEDIRYTDSLGGHQHLPPYRLRQKIPLNPNLYSYFMATKQEDENRNRKRVCFQPETIYKGIVQ